MVQCGSANGLSEDEGKVLTQLARSVGLAADGCDVTMAATGAEDDKETAYQQLRSASLACSTAAGLAHDAGSVLEALTVSAAHAMARAAELLHLVYGQTHALSEANMFTPFFSRLQAPLTSAIVAAANFTLEGRLSETAVAFNVQTN